MSLDSLATVADIEARLGRELTESEKTRVSALLQDASALVRSFTGQNFTASSTTAVFQPVRGVVMLPQLPVIDVLSVDPGGCGNCECEDICWCWCRVGSEIRGLGRQPVRVTYLHGYVEVPDDVVAVVAGMIVRLFSQPGDGSSPAGITSETIGGYSYKLAGPQDGATTAPWLSATDRQMLSHYRVTSHASLPLSYPRSVDPDTQWSAYVYP